MILKKIIPVFVFLFVASLSFGQTTNNTKRKPAKVSSSTVVNKSSAKSVKKNNAVKSSSHKLASGKKMPADFPKYITTGNKEKDVATYRAAKLKWINENPEKYKALFKKPVSN